MSRDYASRGRRSAPRNRRNAPPRAIPGWAWLLGGLSAGLAVAAFIYIDRPSQAELPGAPMPPGDGPGSTQAPAAPRTSKSQIELPPPEPQRFTFYELLPNQEVVLPADVTRSAKPPAAKDSQGAARYLIQVASFRSQRDAEAQKAELEIIGIEARIETVTIDGDTTYYRVRIGPETDWTRVQTLIARLAEHDIDGMLIRLK